MCIICYKPKGEEFPKKATFKTMFENNSDGAGFMYARGGKVYGFKGFKTFGEFWRALEPCRKYKKEPFVFHFRIATHGGINRAMCQPFPLSDSVKELKATRFTAAVGIAHNGIIPMCYDAAKISDTALFIKKYASMIFAGGITPTALEICEQLIQSKMCILDKHGRAYLLGKFIESGGLYYSNDSFRPYKPKKKKPRDTYFARDLFGDYLPFPECDYCCYCDGCIEGGVTLCTDEFLDELYYKKAGGLNMG